MSVEATATKSASEIIRGALPAVAYLLAAFLRLNARRFRAISEKGPFLRRLRLTAALALITGLVSYLLIRTDPLHDLPGLASAEHRAALTALVPLFAMPPMYLLLKWHSKGPAFSTFLNLGLVTSTMLMLIPGTLQFVGANSSALANDMRNLRAGHAAGTPIHQLYCGSIEARAAMEANLRQQDRMQTRLAQNMWAQMANMRLQETHRQKVEERGQRLLRARSAGQPEDALARDLLEALGEGMQLTEQAVPIFEEAMALHRQNLDIMEQGVALQERQAYSPWSIFPAYPTFLGFFVVASIFGLAFWSFAWIITWKLVVTPQSVRWRKWVAGISVVFAGLLLVVALIVLRSGLLEVSLVQELPTRAMIVEQVHAQFDAAAPMCGRMNNYGLW